MFESFSKAVEALPPDEILNALELNGSELSDCNESGDAFSISSFRKFIRSFQQSAPMHCAMTLESDHVAFYWKTLVRLIEAGQLPPEIGEQFVEAFQYSYSSDEPLSDDF